MKLKFYLFFGAVIFMSQKGFNQNLIINPGGESPATVGWKILTKGTDCYTSSDWHIKGNQNGFPVAHGGEYYFYSGCGGTGGEIYQNINLSSFATDIDAGNLNFTFSGYMQVYNQAPADGALMKIEYFNASNTLLVSYNTGITKDLGVWTQYTSTLTAVPGTRSVKITLKSFGYSGSSVDAYFDDLSLTTATILPLQLVSFTTSLDRSNAVVANWVTANELNNDHFELQRSKDGTVWETIARVKGAGTTSTNHFYAAKDDFPIAGVSYYRLVQYDLDGKMSVSKINMMKTEGSKGRLVAYPNPAINILTLEGNEEILKNISIFGPNGQNMNSSVKKSRLSPTRVELNVSSLPNGIYYIRSNGKSTSFYKQ